jgi:hypothetical protein
MATTSGFTGGPPVDECRQGIADLMGYKDYQGAVFLPAFVLQLTDVVQQSDLSVAIPIGWRVIIPDSPGGPLFCSMTLTGDGLPSQLAGVSEGQRAQGALAALRQVQEMPQAMGSELRWLSIPAVLFEGLWLRAQSPDRSDVVNPVFAVDPELQSNRGSGDGPIIVGAPEDGGTVYGDDQPAGFDAAQLLPIIREFASQHINGDDRRVNGPDPEPPK